MSGKTDARRFGVGATESDGQPRVSEVKLGQLGQGLLQGYFRLADTLSRQFRSPLGQALTRATLHYAMTRP